MKICRFDDDRVGLVSGDEVHDLTALAQEIGLTPPSRPLGDPLIMALPRIAERLAGRTPPGPSLRLDDVMLQSPVLLPTKIIGAGNNYKAHKAEMGSDPTASFSKLPDNLEDMGLFLKANTSLIGPSDRIELRFPERRTDYELELVAVIGRKASCVDRSTALSHVAGYCLGLDITLRGPQMRSMRKSIDTYCVAGPWLVTPDEIPDLDNLRLRLEVNGVERQATSTSDMVDDVATLIAYASRFYVLYPGDLIYTGTCSGVGRIAANDVLRIEGEHLGAFETPVVAFTPP